MPKMKRVTIELGAYAHCLYEEQCENFISKYPDNFMLLEGRPCLKGAMYYCRTYLEARVLLAYLGKGGALYSDEGQSWENMENFGKKGYYDRATFIVAHPKMSKDLKRCKIHNNKLRAKEKKAKA